MKLFVTLALSLIIGLTHSFAGENIMQIHDVSALPGDVVTVELEIINDDVFVGFNLDIPIPEGFSYINGTAVLHRKDGHSLSFTINQAGVAKIMAFSFTNTPFPGNDGVMLSFDLQSPDIPGEYPVPIENAVIGNSNAQDIMTGSIDGVIVLESEPEPEYLLTLLADPENAGTLTGEGSYQEGAEVTVSAVAGENYVFINWTEEDVVVSLEPVYAFLMPPADLTLVANFEALPEIHTVHFVVTDASGAPLGNAAVSIDGVPFEPGVFTFELEEGTYNYIVSLDCFVPAQGVLVVDDDMEVPVTLNGLAGDANGDGLVNILDVIMIVNYYIRVDLNVPCFDNADVNNDNDINVLDLILTVNIFAKGHESTS
ncbi:MAG: dockerin type I domain-containing protein [Bacteroidales bacterium]|nr:dockerin type I domain-containing protein [Bacteroidales bacterium]